MQTQVRLGDKKMLLTIPEAAQQLTIGRSTLYELIRAGRIPTVRIQGSVRISAATLEKFVEECTQKQ